VLEIECLPIGADFEDYRYGNEASCFGWVDLHAGGGFYHASPETSEAVLAGRDQRFLSLLKRIYPRTLSDG